MGAAESPGAPTPGDSPPPLRRHVSGRDRGRNGNNGFGSGDAFVPGSAEPEKEAEGRDRPVTAPRECAYLRRIPALVYGELQGDQAEAIRKHVKS